ncbi:hypothetical protein [Actinoplanes sp. NPDC026619]|uniref:hypothetical protein n=1 Tax=Actinoplanes sp. NPDC026619 TaxID=3155798 RepID=UPI0033CD94D9
MSYADVGTPSPGLPCSISWQDCAARRPAAALDCTRTSFLHATFGEYLIARLIVRLLTELAEEEAFGAAGCRDGRLHALLSFAPLTDREPILDFVGELAAQQCTDGARASTAVVSRRCWR